MNKCAHLISHIVEGQHTRMRYGTVLGTGCRDRFKKRTFINLDLKRRGIKKKKKKKNLPCFQAQSATGIVQQLWKYPTGQMVTTSPPRSTKCQQDWRWEKAGTDFLQPGIHAWLHAGTKLQHCWWRLHVWACFRMWPINPFQVNDFACFECMSSIKTEVGPRRNKTKPEPPPKRNPTSVSEKRKTRCGRDFCPRLGQAELAYTVIN